MAGTLEEDEMSIIFNGKHFSPAQPFALMKEMAKDWRIALISNGGEMWCCDVSHKDPMKNCGTSRCAKGPFLALASAANLICAWKLNKDEYTNKLGENDGNTKL